MLRLKKLFTPAQSMDTEAAKNYIADHPEGAFTLLDVRQPGEYEQEHLPGSKLIPLAELSDRRKELDPEKPVLVH